MAKEKEMAGDFYTTYGAAKKLGIHRNTVVRLVLAGKLSATLVGKMYRFNDAQLQDFLAKNTITVSEG